MRSAMRLGMALILSIVGVGAFVLSTSTAADAVSCSVPHQNRTSGWDVVKSGEPIRSGPHASCAQTGTGHGNLSWYLSCWTVNTAGNVWWYGSGSDGTGWVYAQNLVFNNNVRNSSNRCLS